MYSVMSLKLVEVSVEIKLLSADTSTMENKKTSRKTNGVGESRKPRQVASFKRTSKGIENFPSHLLLSLLNTSTPS